MIDDEAFLCSKRPYSKRDAQGALNARMRGRKGHRHNRPDHLRIYHCDHCNAWHLTHKHVKP
jgi:hypothetical protein